MAADTTTGLERIRYWQGQLLASGDLQTQLRVDEELRRLHNRAVHKAYGIAIGLTATLDDGKFTLGCGMAYDCAGRGLIVEADREIPLPAQLTGPMTLVLAYDPLNVDGISLTWKPAQGVNVNTGVAITRLTSNGAGPEIDAAFRPVVARPLARPRMATGNTIPGETAWKPWKVGDEEIGVQVLVDTSAAGFTRVPHYFAEAIAGKPTADFVPAWFASIAHPSTQGFTLQLMLRRITRESLDIADPKVQVSATPTVDNLNVSLETGNLILKDDFVSRLLPIVEQASVITALAGGIATLDVELKDFTSTRQVAFGNPPRLAEVQETSDTPSFEVTVDNIGDFEEGQVVFELNDTQGTARPARIVSNDETDTLEIFPPIAGLKDGDILAVARLTSTVMAVSPDGLNITVAGVENFVEGGMVVRLVDPVENSAPAKIREIKADTSTLVLFTKIPNLAPTDPLGFAITGEAVSNVTDIPNETRVTVVDKVKQFRIGDIVAKRFADGSFSAPVRVKDIKIKKRILDLSSPIPGLIPGDMIAAADFRVRATVLEQPITTAEGQPLTTVKVADSSVFSMPAFVARIDDLLKASVPIPVHSIPTSRTLELTGTIDGLEAGDVIGMCAFPVTLNVQRVLPDGQIEVSDGALLRESDLVMALPAQSSQTGLAIIANKTGNLIRLAGTIEKLDTGDSLSVANIRGVIEIDPVGTSTPAIPKVTVQQSSRVRQGDFLADITGWLQPRLDTSSAASVTGASGNQITLSGRLDGLLKNDTIGLASIILSPSLSPFFFIPFLQIRLSTMPDLRPGDEVLLVGLDRLRGDTRSMFTSVWLVFPSSNRVLLFVGGSPGSFTFRPEDILASVLFVRGSALALIQKNDLFVTWLAIGEPDPMPKPCIGKDVPDSPCL